MSWFLKEEGYTKPEGSNVIHLDEILDQFKLEITNHMNKETEKFKLECMNVYQDYMMRKKNNE